MPDAEANALDAAHSTAGKTSVTGCRQKRNETFSGIPDVDVDRRSDLPMWSTGKVVRTNPGTA